MQRSFSIRIVEASESDLGAVAELAAIVWRAHYPGIITHGQIEYMLARGYSHDALLRFLTEAGSGLLLAYDRERLIGFAAYFPTGEADELKLDRLYVHQDYHGCGVGSRLIARVEETAGAQRLRTLILQVNKNNKAKSFYEKLGFSEIGYKDFDIGNGFFMNDYVMEKVL